jgi:hypothetical protein
MVYSSSKVLIYRVTPRNFDFINLMTHERGFHGTRFLNGEKWDPATKEQLWESEAYRGQMKHPSWINCSEEFRDYIKKEAKSYLK